MNRHFGASDGGIVAAYAARAAWIAVQVDSRTMREETLVPCCWSRRSRKSTLPGRSSCPAIAPGRRATRCAHSRSLRKA
ncbi:MAG: hypothetical protein MZV70_33725 [Desulfobacterales bacterium]|nr:hypothetical protein [Desulfobacterales bacterium]